MIVASDFYFGGLNRNRNQTTNVAFRATERVLQEELRAEKVAGESFKASHFHRHTRSAWKTKTLTADDWLRTKSHYNCENGKILTQLGQQHETTLPGEDLAGRL